MQLQVSLVVTHLCFNCRLFTKCPAMQEIFTKFYDIQLEMLPENKLFCKHAFQVSEAIGTVVFSLDDISALVPVLKVLGKVHCDPALNEEHFDVSYDELWCYRWMRGRVYRTGNNGYSMGVMVIGGNWEGGRLCRLYQR